MDGDGGNVGQIFLFSAGSLRPAELSGGGRGSTGRMGGRWWSEMLGISGKWRRRNCACVVMLGSVMQIYQQLFQT